MMYPFMTLNDETEIVHSEILPDASVKVYIEKPDADDGFHNVSIYLPSYDVKDNNGFSKEEINYFLEIVKSTSHLIMNFAANGGFENASNF